MNKQFIMLTAFMFATPYTMHAMKTSDKPRLLIPIQDFNQNNLTDEQIHQHFPSQFHTPSPIKNQKKLSNNSLNSSIHDDNKDDTKMGNDITHLYDEFSELYENRSHASSPDQQTYNDLSKQLEAKPTRLVFQSFQLNKMYADLNEKYLTATSPKTRTKIFNSQKELFESIMLTKKLIEQSNSSWLETNR